MFLISTSAFYARYDKAFHTGNGCIKMGHRSYAFKETWRWTNTSMQIFVTCLNTDWTKLANLPQRIIHNNLCTKWMEISPTTWRTHTHYTLRSQEFNSRQAQWWTNLSRYNYQLIHIPRAELIQADALSWCPDHTKGEDDDELVTMLPEEQFISLVAVDLHNQIKTLSLNDEFIQGIIKCLKEQSMPPLWLDPWWQHYSFQE